MTKVFNTHNLPFKEKKKQGEDLKLYFRLSHKIFSTSLELSWNLFQSPTQKHCIKSVQIRSYFWSLFFCIRIEYEDLLRKSPYSIRIQENTEQKLLRIWTLFTFWNRRNCKKGSMNLGSYFQIHVPKGGLNLVVIM